MAHLFSTFLVRRGLLMAAFQISALPLIVTSIQPFAIAAASSKASAAAAASARGKAILKATEAKLTAAKTISFTCTTTLTDITGKKTPSSTVVIRRQRPGLLSCSLMESGKEIGRIVNTPDGGYVFDDAGNRYTKIEKASTTPEALRNMMTAAMAVLPNDKLSSLAAVSEFLGDNPLLMPSNSKMTVQVRSYMGQLNGKPANHVTQTMEVSKISMTVHVYTDPQTSLPERFAVATVYDGKSGGMHMDFSDFQVGDTALADSTFSVTPPATAVAFTPPAAPQEQPLLAAGAVAPDFAVQDVTSKTSHLADFAGKVVVLDFWSTWCGPCQESLPGTDKLAKSYKGKGVVFLPICSWDDKSAFTPWVKKRMNWTMKFYFDPNGRGDKSIAATLYKVSGIPTQFVIGKDGNVTNGFVGYDGAESEKKLRAAIDKALAGS